MTPPSLHGCLGLAFGLAVASAFVAGCGDDGRALGTPDPEHARAVARNPYALTCRDLASQSHPEAARLVIRAQVALAREPSLRKRVAEQTLQRASQSVFFALTEVCKGRDPSFRPARVAVEGVRRGKYRAEMCVGSGCE